MSRGGKVGGYGVCIPSRLSTSKWSLITLISLASWIVCTVALLPEPWKASSVGFTGPPMPASLGAMLGVMYVLFSVCAAILARCGLGCGSKTLENSPP